MNSRTAWYWILAIVVLTMAAYAGSFHGAFVYDDLEGISQNLSIRHWATLFSPPEGTTPSGRPVLNASLALSYAISGPRPWGYHLVNVIIQVVAALALFGVLRRAHPAIAGPAALLWAVHPLHTESVTYVVQRAESMMGMFYLLSLYCFVRSTSPTGSIALGSGSLRGFRADLGVKHETLGAFRYPIHRMRWDWLSIAFCWLGMATKEVMVTAPAIIFLYDRTFVSGSFRTAWQTRKLYYLALASSWLFLAALIATTGGNRSGTIGFGIGISPFLYALTQFRAIVTYLRLSFWPHPLIIDYGPLWVHSLVEVIPYALIVIALLAATAWALVRRPGLGFWGAWFFLILSPTSSFVPGTTQIIVEHRMYLSLIAILVLAALALQWVAERLQAFRGPTADRPRNARSVPPKVLSEVEWATPILCGIAIVFAALTFARNQVYASEASLWMDTVARVPDNPNAHDALGLVWLRQGKIEDAMAEYRTAQRLSPELIAPLENLGDADVKLGQYQAAFDEFQTAIRKNPRYAPVRVDLGNLLLESGQFDAAIAQYTEALRLRPGSSEAQNDWGLALVRSGRAPESVAHFKAALQLNPILAEAQYNWGNAARIMGQIDEAMAHYQTALDLKPDYADPALNLGNLLMQQNQLPAAIAHFQLAIRFSPGWPDAHNSLALALARSGDLRGAIAECEVALRLRPNFPAAQANIILFRRRAGLAE